MRHSNQLVFALGIFLGLQACSGNPDAPSGEMKLHKECLKTVCAARAEENADACTRCLDACSSASYDCDPSSECSYSCDSTSDCTSDACDTEGFKATLPNNPSPELQAACGRELAHISECGLTSSATAKSCATFAAVERPEMAAQYDCVAALACDDLMNKDAIAQCDPAPSTFGDELCAQINATCDGACTNVDSAVLNLEGAWLRSDALAAGRTCATQTTCDDKKDCLSAWETAVGLR